MVTNPERLFLDELPQIEKVIGSICRRHCCFGPDAEDFSSTVKVKLIDNDYAVLRKFQGKSQLSTYLTMVISNQFRDFRIHKWGKWRPSAAAKKLGAAAIQLEQLRVRDSHSLDEAVRILRTNLGDDAPSPEDLFNLATKLPVRAKRRFEGEDKLENVPDQRQADERLVREERTEKMTRAKDSLDQALGGLSPEDRLIIKLRFEEGLTVARISKQLGIPQRALYSRIEKILKTLRKTLEADGVDPEVTRILGWE